MLLGQVDQAGVVEDLLRSPGWCQIPVTESDNPNSLRIPLHGTR